MQAILYCKSTIAKAMNMLLVSSLFLIMCACDKVFSGVDNSNQVYIMVLDSDGNDLLDPDNPSKIDIDLIKVYYELNGVKTEINRSNLDSPKMFRIGEPSDYMNLNNYYVLLFMNSEEKSSTTSITYFEWNPNRTDIFKSMVERSRGSTHLKKAWFNDNLICDGSLDTGLCRVTIIMD